jgi:fructose-1,6-bisphosphatase/inositol monophosphatase family enzyme
LHFKSKDNFTAGKGNNVDVFNDFSAVSELLREAAATTVMPVYRMREAQPEEKSPGEWVTTADRAGEEFLTPALLSLIPGCIVIGEEAASSNLGLLNSLTDEGYFWLLDPLDGTANFAAGVPPFAMMIALVRNGETFASWILDPMSNRLVVAEKGAGAWIDGEQIRVDSKIPSLNEMTGAVLRRFLSEDFQDHIATVETQFRELTLGSKCAGFDYPDICTGSMHFAMYWRTLPWDHAPGVLILQEAGGTARRLDGSSYRPSDHKGFGLLAARNEEIWSLVSETLVKRF